MRMYESCFAVAVADEPFSVGMARQLSHDDVIARTGETRRSGVRWSYFSATKYREEMAADGLDIEILPDSDAAIACSLFPDGVLVMATVEIEA